MPLYMDIHELPEGVTPEDIAKAHHKDMEIQGKYGVEYSKYWVNESGRKLFCLAHAPNAEAAERVHREAHGMVAEKIIEIQPELAEGISRRHPHKYRWSGGAGRSARPRSRHPNHFVYGHCEFDGVNSCAGRRRSDDVARCA